MSHPIRIGIDVGGTFTHAVALDADDLRLLGKAKVPTTHRAAEGVARGVVEALRELLRTTGIGPHDVRVIAHSTTQATNALLEGDVAPVGILGMAAGLGALLAARQTHVRGIPLAAGRVLQTHHRFLKSGEVTESAVRRALEALRDDGATVIVAAAAFSVDDPTAEQLVLRVAAELGLPATATHLVSQLHGLALRTRTAVVNACMMPRMLGTAEMTERAVRAAGIAAPLMVMRSDGGVMTLDDMRRRPILTMLSGPAAGVAAALLYARVSDGIFLEVGGTSTDIAAIRSGRVPVRSANIGGHKLSVSTLDVRTVGVAGGSLVHGAAGRIDAVGPRSAHLAGLPYLSFAAADTAALRPARLRLEERDYLVMTDGAPPKDAPPRYAITPTCAANQLGLVPDGDPAAGQRPLLADAFAALAKELQLADGAAAADAVLAAAMPKLEAVVRGLIADYRLDPGVLRLVGGGGGAAAIVPYLAKKMGLPHDTVPDADVISAIGVALAMVRDVVERTATAPGEAEIRAIREEAAARVLRMGAAADTIEVLVEVDARRNLLRATAEGALAIERREHHATTLDAAQRRQLVAASIGPCLAPPTVAARAAGFEVWTADCRVSRFWGLLRQQRTAVRVLDEAGTIRWSAGHALCAQSTAAHAASRLETLAETATRYSDAGSTIPGCFVLIGGRVLDLSGLVDMPQVLGVLRMELARHAPDAACVLLVRP